MVSEFVVVWFELNWLRDVAGSAFFVKGTPVRRVLPFQGGRVVWLLGSWMSYQRYAVLKYKQC